MTTNIIEIETNISQLTTELSGFSPRNFHEDPPVGGTDVDIQLLEAAKAGDMAVVEKLILANQHSVNCRDLDGRHSTPLHVAAGYNRVTVVDFLLKHGADVHAKDKGALVPLHNACSYGHYEVTELLIKHKADVNVADLWKFTPLHEAAAEGKLEICKLLLKHGADATKKNKDGNTPLDLVKECDNDVANLLRGDAALLEAAEKGKSSQVQKLSTQENINCRENQGRNSTPLHLAGLEIKKEGRTSPNRTKFRKLSREVCGEVCDIPENNSVIFVYEKRPSKVSLIGEISYQFCDLKIDSPGSNFDSEFYSQITFMFVKEDFQLQGIGKKLVKKVLNEFKGHDKSRPIRIQSAGRAVGFFEKLGFVKVGDIMETVCGISVFRFMQNMERPIPSPT